MADTRLTDEEAKIVCRLADGEDPWTIDPMYGCTNPLTGYFPSGEVRAELARRKLEEIGYLINDLNSAVQAFDWQAYYETMTKLRDLIND